MVAFDAIWDDSGIQSIIDLRSSEALAEIRSSVHGAKVRNGKIMARHIRAAEQRGSRRSRSGFIVPQAFSDAINKAYSDAVTIMDLTARKRFEQVRGEGMTNAGRVRFAGLKGVG